MPPQKSGRQTPWTKYRDFPRTQGQFEEMVRDLDVASLSREVFTPKSSCPRVVKGPINCRPDAKTMMQAVMCRAWYRVPPNASRDLLVESFRKNLRTSWEEYRTACPR